MPDLGDGEREAIALAQALPADVVLIDEGDGRREAHARGLRVTGTFGVLERRAIRGLVDLPSMVARLRATTFRARADLYRDLLARDAARHPPAGGRSVRNLCSSSVQRFLMVERRHDHTSGPSLPGQTRVPSGHDKRGVF